MTEGNSQTSEHPRKLDAMFVGGVAWTAAAKWMSQLISWPSVIIAARFLSPSDFGTVEMAGFYFTLTNVLVEFGLGTAILQMRELEAKTIEQMNTLSLLSGVFAFGVTQLMAPFIAGFFHTPVLSQLIRVTSILFLMIGLQVAPFAMLERDMDYRRLSVAEAFQACVQGVVTIGGAMGGLGLWTLPMGNLAGRAASMTLTRFWKPVRFAIPHWNDIKHPLHLGTELAFQKIAWAAYLQSDGMVIGRVLGQSILGTYRLAISLASAPADKIGMLIMRVTGPLFARIQADQNLMRRYFLVLSEIISLAVFPLVAGLIAVAPETVMVLLGPKWSAAVIPLRWLAAFTVVRLLSSLAGQVLVSLRYTRFNSWMSVINTLLMPAAFFTASFWGAGAVASAWIWMAPLTILPTILKVLKALDCGRRKYLTVLMPASLASAFMIAVVLVLKHVLPASWPLTARLALEVAVGGCSYGGFLFGIFGERVTQFIRFFFELRKSPSADHASMAPVVE